MAGMFFGHGGHGHSHANGAECQGHGPPKDMSEEMRQKLLQQLEARMQEMQSRGHSHNHKPSVNSLEPDPLKTSFNSFLYGYGHEPPTPPNGWDVLAKVASPETASADVGVLGASRDLSARDNFWSVNVPVLGRLRVVKDGQGWVMASCVVLYWIYGNWSTWNAILLPYYYDGTMNLFFLLTYAFVSVMCIASFFRASTLSPGSLQTSQTPQETWTDCKTCLQKRPPLCHHCRRCGQCVRKMDHHCPWINNCVGEENQFAFIQLLVYACLLSANTLALQAAHFFWLGGCKTCDQDSFVIYYRTPIILICVAMATVMLVSMVGLCLTQHISITHGTTTVEWMKLQQQIFMTGIIPENIPEQTQSCCHTYSVLCGSSHAYLWMFPCRRRLTTVEKASVV